MDAYILDQFTDKKKGLAPLYTTPCYKVGGDLALSPLGAVGFRELKYSPILVLCWSKFLPCDTSQDQVSY